MERLFTEDEANALLPHLRELLGRLREARGQLAAGAHSAGLHAASNGSAAAAALSSAAESIYNELLAEIDGLGVIVRDVDTGLVDFAATRNGEPVYLCWRLGEERVAHWHPRDTGIAGREPL